MGLFDKQKQETVVVEKVTDSLGGGGLLETNVYTLKVEMAYIEVAKSGATGVMFRFKGPNGETHNENIYPISGDAKGNKHYYVKDGKNFNLPGFNTVESICCLVDDGFHFLDMEMDEQVELKTIKVWDSELKKETPQEKQVISALVGKDITVAIQQIIQDKTEKFVDGDGKTTYPVVAGQTVTKCEIKHVFSSETGYTLTEAMDNAAQDDELPAEFQIKWQEKNKGKVQDKSTKDKSGAKPGAPATGGQGTKTKLF